jgi:5-methylcytosine-specific restriction enzyme A
MLFCNIGWMNHYNGIDGDKIERGGAYNKDAIGHEVCNFSDINGILYGYVQPNNQIKLENLQGKESDTSISGITVVWTAGPKNGGTVVVGWYNNATVYRNAQKINSPTPLQKLNNISHYWVECEAKNSKLLSIEHRELLIPRGVKGGIGQSNVWYGNSPESAEIIKRVSELVANGITHVLPDVDFSLSGKEGNPRLVAHLRRERNSAVVKAKKEAILQLTGKLCCEVCNFDFHKTYGNIGRGFCEVHHLKQLSKSDGIVTTKLDDLAIVCSNCHRIIHHSDPMYTIKALKKTLMTVVDS